MRNVPHQAVTKSPQVRPAVDGDVDYLLSAHNISTANIKIQMDLSSGNCHSFTVDGNVVALAGASYLWEGVWQVWALVSPGIRNHGLFFTKHIRSILHYTAIAYDIRRYNAIVDATNVEHIRWIKLLGFEYEYTMYRASEVGTDILGWVRWNNLGGI